MKNIVVIGDSGHSKVIVDIINESKKMQVSAKLDDKYNETFIINGVLKGPISYLHKLIKDDPNIGVIIGIGSNEVRKKLVSLLGLKRDFYITAIDQSAKISPSAKIGLGTVVMPGSIINAEAVIGDHVIVNSGAIIEHDCNIDNFVHISPRATLTGGVKVGEGTQVGAGAVVIPTKTIGSWSMIGAGAVVINDFGNQVLTVGIPAKEKRE